MPSSHFVGKAGQLAVMGEFAWRGYNVAMPEIDIGDDIFVYRDATNQIWRIQVKTLTRTQQVNSDRYQFRVRETQITTPANPALYFILALRREVGWRFVVIDRGVLHNYRQMGQFGSDYEKNGITWVNLNITLHHAGPQAGHAICSQRDLTHHLDNFDPWPAV